MNRSFDSDWFNTIINHPEVYPLVVGEIEGPLDASALVQDNGNYLLATELGGFLYHNRGEGTYEVHTQFIPEGRTGVVKLAKESLHYMFTKTDCVEVLTKVPVGNIPAKILTKLCGFSYMFTGSKWKIREEYVPIEFYRLGIEEWTKGAKELIERGEWFHNKLEDLGVETDHDEDTIHNRYVGLALEMALAKQPLKGVVYYNRWAKFYGYEPVKLVSVNPCRVDINTAVIEISNEEIKVCQ